MNFVVKPRRSESNGGLSFRVMGVWMGVLVVGLFLFCQVWWPIQAERASKEIKRLEIEASVKKSELDRLRSQYEDMVSLRSLELVAKASGHWINPTAENVITLSK